MLGARPRTPATCAARSSASRSRTATSRPPRRTRSGRRTTSRPATSIPVGTARTRPEVYAMGFRNPFRITLDKNDVAYITDYSPDSNVPQQFRGPAGTGRYMVVRKPSNYGWPLCYKTDLPYYQWDFNTSTPLPSAAAPETHECNNPTRGPRNTSRWVASGGPAIDPGLEYGASGHEPGDLVLVPRQLGTAEWAAGDPVLRELRARRTGEPDRRLPAAVPGALHRGRRPARHGAVQLQPAEPQPDEVPALLGRGLHRRRVHAGHAARGQARLERRCPQDQQHAALRPRAGNADTAVALRQPDGHGVRP